ncbi:N-formylglutamate amidohydrolase [Rhodobacteraceae bacterium D3-12]|nr:N-formylglutamate amidohydrolase [Rhodobacteraceae bacterium D3-12]
MTLNIFFPYVKGMVFAESRTLLAPSDPPPVEKINAESASPIFLLCEHAGKAIPAALGDLGVTPDVIESHRGWDIGAEDLARRLADLLGAPLVIQRYSRLVIDCNRPHDSARSVPLKSDGVVIPSNQSASAADRFARVEEIFMPMNAAISRLMEGRKAAFSVHSFTPNLGGQARPWHAGFLSRADQASADAFVAHLSNIRPDLHCAVNQPYQIEADTDWFVPAHAEPRGVRHCLIEVRNDQLGDDAGIAQWADLLANAITAILEPS